MPTTTQLYAWAVPAFIDESPVDHAWVTSYDNRTQNFADIAAVIAANQDYWFCWGDYHAKGGTPSSPSGFLGSQSGDLNVARCLVQPNADCSSILGPNRLPLATQLLHLRAQFHTTAALQACGAPPHG